MIEDEVRTQLTSRGARKRIGEAKGLFKDRTIAYEPVELTSRVTTDKVSEAKKILEMADSMFTPVLKTLLAGKDKFNRDEAERMIDEKIIQTTPVFEKRLPTIAVLAAVAPLLGLLGTVSGMIQLFDVITLYGTSNPKILAGGISVALVTTQAGLGLAIPLTLVHHILVRRKINILNNVESMAIDVLTALYPDKVFD